MYLIIDLEATCWKRNEGHYGENEIIEIGAVVIGDDYEIVEEIQRFVRPVRNPVLSDFCKRLTSITQADVDSADPFPNVLRGFQAEAERVSGQRLRDLIFCSWGDYDRNQLKRDCQYHRLTYPFGRHRNVKKEFARNHRIKPVGIPGALKILGIQFEGNHHRGIDDARNIARIFIHESTGT
ncbi:exonuclease domain-containing protein [Candidatus Poribacteria bacterium]